MEIPFPSESPINTNKLGGQNKKIYDHLSSGNTINSVQAQEMFITALPSRISDLRNKHGIKIFDRFINIGNDRSMVKEYSLTQLA